MRQLRYAGQLRLDWWGEAIDVLFVSTLDEPLAEVLEDEIAGEIVTARYWITDEECSRDEAQEEALKRVMGCADCLYLSRYSEITGYLWTDEEINIGGHDLLAELARAIGKWLILEIDVYETGEGPGRG